MQKVVLKFTVINDCRIITNGIIKPSAQNSFVYHILKKDTTYTVTWDSTMSFSALVYQDHSEDGKLGNMVNIDYIAYGWD